MTAVDHYREAERLLDCTDSAPADRHGDERTALLAAAQVHATLALAGATAMQAYVTGDSDELTDWETAAGGDG